jgi:hypothetical protein
MDDSRLKDMVNYSPDACNYKKTYYFRITAGLCRVTTGNIGVEIYDFNKEL